MPGAELAGTIAATGDGVEGWCLGDRVYAGVSIGAYAEKVALPAADLHRIPSGMSFEEAAAMPVVYPTSYAGLVFRGELQPGETLLVHAAAGGVGLAAVQIGKALGARVIATAGGAEKLEVAAAAGADVTIDYRDDGWVDAVMSATEGRGADVIYDPVGGDITQRSLKCIAWNGRLVVCGFASGDIPEIALNRVLLKNIAITGLHWGAYAQREPERVPETFAALERLYETGAIRPVIWKTYPLAELPQALAELGSRNTHGKLILQPTKP